MATHASVVVRAFDSVGWHWGGAVALLEGLPALLDERPLANPSIRETRASRNMFGPPIRRLEWAQALRGQTTRRSRGHEEPQEARRDRRRYRGLVAAFAVAWMASVSLPISPAGVPAATSQYEKKVTICHRTGPKKNPFRTIRVSRNAVKAHLRHGDVLGPCGSAVFTMCHKTTNGKKQTVKVKGARRAQRAMKRGQAREVPGQEA